MIMEYYPTTEALATALLYNLVRQDVLPNDKIIREFGIEIANKIEELANLHGPKHAISATQIKRMIEKGDRDILIIKLLNDLYIMQNISIKPKWEQLEAALQVLKTSLPLAMYINLPEIESGLEAICRSIIIPELARDESTSLSPDFNFELLKFQL
jgi:(p)ppGpp synthase/HD superfamily hydrolase